LNERASGSPLSADFGREQRSKSVQLEPDGFMTDLDSALMQKILDVAQ
jgi:hypothetical protein